MRYLPLEIHKISPFGNANAGLTKAFVRLVRDLVLGVEALPSMELDFETLSFGVIQRVLIPLYCGSFHEFFQSYIL